MKKMMRVHFVELLICLGLAAISAAILVPNFVRAKSRTSNPCRYILKRIGVALEMYSTDFKGEYPSSLDLLTPNYLRAIPTCPNAGQDTFSAGYRAWKEPGVGCPVAHENGSDAYKNCNDRRQALHKMMRKNGRESVKGPFTCPASGQTYKHVDLHQYRFCCQGGNHTEIDISADYPAYDTIGGLQARP